MLDPFLSHEVAIGPDHRGQRVVLVRVERDIFHLLRLLSRLLTAECLQRTRYPRRARRRSAYIPSTGFEPVLESSQTMGYRIGVDVGGTFTDLALIDEASGALTIGKVPSVPTDPAVGILQGIQQLLTENGIAPNEVTYLAHGTTVATNTLLQHKGAMTGLITTRGFRDLLEIARQRRPTLYDLRARKPTVLVPRDLRFEVTERVMADGGIRLPLDMAEVDRALAALADARVEALAICFLY